MAFTVKLSAHQDCIQNARFSGFRLLLSLRSLPSGLGWGSPLLRFQHHLKNGLRVGTDTCPPKVKIVRGKPHNHSICLLDRSTVRSSALLWAMELVLGLVEIR
jgi:hypothetical protein